MSDWEDFADENIEIKNENVNKKFEDEKVVDKDKEEREAKAREEEQRIKKEEAKKNREEKKKDEKDYDKLFEQRFQNAGAVTTLTREQVKQKHPNLTDAQIDELISRESDASLGDNLFGDDAQTPKNTKEGLASSIKELKGEKNYKLLGKEVAEYICANGQSNNFIPKFFSELFNGLADKITVTKMRSIVSDFDDKLKKKKEEEDIKEREAKKLEKKPKSSKKPKLAGVTKALDTNKLMVDDVFGGKQYGDDDGEGEYDDYGDEGDGFVDGGRVEYDFM